MSSPASTRLPEGTITFLLTDIRKSTALWEEHGEEMAHAVERHEAIIAGATEHNNGVLLRSKGEGDSCFCVFARATDALAAALQAQVALGSEPWPGPRIEVRMALHTGAAELRDNQYYGTVVNRCARLRGIGHGGQTLLSSSTATLVGDTLPERATLKELGAHRLPDLAQPERVYQLCHPRLREVFPALVSLDAYPNNLPMQLTRFVGREQERADIERLLSTERLVTITGPGGCGKTRLGLQTAADLLEQFVDGVWMVGLASIADSTLIVPQLASTLGLREEPGRSLMDVVADYLREKHVLLVLDNCEHVLRAAALLTANLLATCSRLRIVATSRQALGIEGEVTTLLNPLPVPPSDNVGVADLLRYEGAQLLSDRAGLALAGFTVNEHNASSVAQICRRLDGIPLAIELAAARIGSLGPTELARRLDDRFRLLAGGRRGGPARHQTLEAAVDWSYELCDDDERLLFRRLSVFAGIFTLETVEHVSMSDGLEHADAAELVSRLVDRSLIHADSSGNDVTYRMLQTIRSYALTRLERSGEETAARSRHLDRFLSLAEQAEEQLVGPDQATWLARLEADHDDIRAALSWSLSADPSRGIPLAAALGVFWDARGHWAEGRRWLEAALTVAAEGDPYLATLLTRAGNLAYEQGDYAKARAYLGHSLTLRRTTGDVAGTAHALSLLADLEIASGNLEIARGAFEEALLLTDELGQACQVGLFINLAMAGQALSHHGTEDLYRRALAKSRSDGHKRGIAGALVGLGTIARGRGDLDTAKHMHEEALALFRELNDRFGSAETLASLAAILRSQRELEAAAELLREALPLYRELGDRRGTATTLIRLGVDAAARGNPEAARHLLEEALDLCRALADPQGIAASLTYLARIAHSTGDDRRPLLLLDEAVEWCRRIPMHRTTATCLEEVAGFIGQTTPEAAATLFGAADALRNTLALTGERSGQEAYDHALSKVRLSLGEDRFDAAWSEGSTMSAQQAIEFARMVPLSR